MSALSLKFARRHVRAEVGRMLLSVVAIALGVALVVALQLMNAAVQRSFLDSIDAMVGRASLTISAGEGLTFPEALVDEIQAVPGVKLAVPLVRSVAFPDDDSGEMLTVHGVDLANEAAVRLYHDAAAGSEGDDDVVEDLGKFLNAPAAILVGREFGERRGLRTGDALSLVTPTGLQRFVVQGLLEPKGVARTLRGRFVVMDLFAAERAFASEQKINQIDVVVGDTMRPDEVGGAIARVLPAGLRVEEPTLRKTLMRETLAGIQAILSAFSILAVVAGFVICYSRLNAVFEARLWEVGLLRAIGLERFQVVVELLKESLLLGAAGSFLGVVLGMVIGRYALPVLAATTAIALKLPEPSAQVITEMRAVWLGMGVGLIAALLAALVPAVRVANVEPARVLAKRGVVPHEPRSGLWVALLIVALVLVVLADTHLRSVWLGHLATGLVISATCLLAPRIVHVATHTAAPLWRRWFGFVGRMGIHHLGERARQTTLTVATLGVGLGAVLLFGLLGWSFERTLATRLTSRFRSALVVTSARVAYGAREAGLHEEILDELRRIPGIRAVAAIQQGDLRSGDGSVRIDAYDAAGIRDPSRFVWRLDDGATADATETTAAGTTLMVSSAFAYQHETKVGDILEIQGTARSLRLPVAAITLNDPANVVLMSRELYRSISGDELVWQVHVYLAPDAASDRVATAIRRQLGVPRGIRVRSSAEVVEYYASLVHQAFGILYLTEAIIFLLVVVAIGDTLATGVLERTRQFGTLRALGMTRPSIFRVVLVEGAAIGLLGLLLAAAAGAALGVFWVNVQFPVILGWKLDLHFPALLAAAAGALAITLCLAGSLLPAWRASHVSVPAALSGD